MKKEYSAIINEHSIEQLLIPFFLLPYRFVH
jgi:hypothetical protein